MSEHSPLSPSSLHRHVRCAGAYAAEETLPNETSEAAEEGTLAHEYGAALLQGKSFHMVGVDDEMQRLIAGPGGYVDFVLGYAHGAAMFAVEYRVYLVPFVHGTADVIILYRDDRGWHLVVIDLKYGFMPVDAAGNEQLCAYLLGAFKLFDGLVGEIVTARGVIYQPRQHWKDRPADSDAYFSRAYLAQFERELVAMVRASADPAAKRTPTKYGCQWCRAKNRPDICPERAAWIEAQAAQVRADDLEGFNVVNQ